VFTTELELDGYFLDELCCKVTVKADWAHRPSRWVRGRYMMQVREGHLTTYNGGGLTSEDIAKRLFDLSRQGYQLHVISGSLDLL